MWIVFATLLALPAPLDSLERDYGPSQTVAAASNGLLSIAVGPRGDLTALRWPGPLGLDQLHFVTRPTREGALPAARNGADLDQGLFVGLRLEQDGETWVEWLHQDKWSAQVTYLSDSSSVIRVDYHSLLHQADASVEYWLATDQALLAIHAELLSFGGRALPLSWLLYENLAPCNRRVEGQAGADWRNDQDQEPSNDFAALYSEAADALVHFLPAEAQAWQSRLAPQISMISADQAGRAAADGLVDDLADSAAEGLYFTLGADQQSQAVQVGRVDPEDRARPRDAYFDASDDVMSMQPAAMGRVNGALEVRRRVTGGGRTFYLAAGTTLGQSLQVLENARLLGLASLSTARLERDQSVERSLVSARTEQASIDRVVRRSLRTILQAQDPESGALALATGAQPPLALDCAARSVFANEALMLAGQWDRAQEHLRFWARAIIAGSDGAEVGWLPDCVDPEGRYAAGSPRAIDATALNLWATSRLVTELRAANKSSQASILISDLADATQLSAQALMNCEDATTDLTCAAASGGEPSHPADLLAAAVTVAGLEGAVSLVADEVARNNWTQRATQLRQAAITEFVDTDGRLLGSPRGRALAVYPGRLLRDNPNWRQREIGRLLDEVEATLVLSGTLDDDLALVLWSLLRASDEDEGLRSRLRPLVLALLDLANADRAQYGARFHPVDSNGDGEANVLRSQLATPYLPVSALVYANAILLLGPRPALDQQGPIDTCFCTHVDPRQAWLLAGLLLLAAALRRRHATDIVFSQNSATSVTTGGIYDRNHRV